MSRDWMLLLILVTVSTFTLANSILLAIGDSDDQNQEIVGDQQVRMRSPKKKGYELIEMQEFLKDTPAPNDDGNDDYSTEEPVDKIKSIKHYFRDLYKLNMNKSSLEEKLKLGKKVYNGSLKDVQVIHYLDILQVAIDAKRDYAAAQKSLAEAVNENDKKVFREEVKKTRKFAKQMVQQVHGAEDRLRTRMQRKYIRPAVKYGIPGGLIAGAVSGIVGTLHYYNILPKLPWIASENATSEHLEPNKTVETLAKSRGVEEEVADANSLQEENKKKSSDISRANFAIAIAFGVILLMVSIAIGGILLVQRYGSADISDSNSNSSSNDNSYDILSSGLGHSGKVY